MEQSDATLYLDTLCNRIDITSVPFSDRGSRLMVFRDPGKASLHIRLAERLTTPHMTIDSYRTRPPFVRTCA